MGYIKFEGRHLDQDHWLDLSAAAFTVHTWALSYCNEQATDGTISKARAHRLNCPVPPADLPDAWQELTAAGVWISADDIYTCPSFLAHGIAADEQDATRAKWAEDKRRQRLHKIGNHAICTGHSCPAATRMSTGGQVDTSTGDKWTTRPDPTRPDPTRPDPEGVGVGVGGQTRSARATRDAPDGKGKACYRCTSKEPDAWMQPCHCPEPEAVSLEKHHHHNSDPDGDPGCCVFWSHPTNRHHYKPGECPGCDDPHHKDQAAA